jgi:hypothetical protein
LFIDSDCCGCETIQKNKLIYNLLYTVWKRFAISQAFLFGGKGKKNPENCGTFARKHLLISQLNNPVL